MERDLTLPSVGSIQRPVMCRKAMVSRGSYTHRILSPGINAHRLIVERIIQTSFFFIDHISKPPYKVFHKNIF